MRAIILPILLLVCAAPTAAERVARVVDGDTIRLADGRSVRYIGMDTPELHHPRRPVEPYAREAAEANRALVAGREVRLEYDVQRYDRYGRTLAYVYLGKRMVNAELVRQGYAVVATFPPNVRHQALFLRLEREARAAGRGLWAGSARPASRLPRLALPVLLLAVALLFLAWRRGRPRDGFDRIREEIRRAERKARALFK